MKVDFDVRGDEKAVAGIREIGERAQNTRPVFNDVALVLESGLRRQFESGGSYLGGGWKRNAEATLERKARLGQGSQVLVATGALRGSLTGGSGHGRRITKTMVRVGTKNFTARFAQGGTSRGEPARKLLGVAERDRERCVDLIRQHLTS